MLCCQMFASLLLLLIYQAPTPGLAQVPTPAPVKYAPNYCLRFRFNCNRPEKKSHVCCLYPLPENGNENEEEKRPTPNYGTAVKFRPVKLPKTNPKKGDNDNSGSGNDQRGDTNPGPSRNKPSASPANLGKGRPKFSPSSTATSAAAAKQPPLSKPSKKSTSSKIKSGVRPRICERLVIDCINSPEHRCCQYKVPSQASHYREVPRWDIFMEQELRFGLNLRQLALLKKKVWADYEQLFRPVFSSLHGQKKQKTFQP